jgi:DNA repair exonuclease SbcCD ATPase subunit
MAGRSYLKTEPKTASLVDAISDAYSEISSLAEEMESWRDGLEEKLSHTSKYDQVSEAYDLLSQHADEPDCDNTLFGTMQVHFVETSNKNKKRSVSRATRLDNAINRLNACIEVLEARKDELEEAKNEEEIKDDAEALEEVDSELDEINELIYVLEQTVSELDGGVEFPGMFG